VSLFCSYFKINEKKIIYISGLGAAAYAVFLGLQGVFTIFSGPMTSDSLKCIDQKWCLLSAVIMKPTDAL